MKNFKQIAFGLLVGSMALGFSAFTSSHSNAAKRLNTWYYTLGSDKATYTRVGTAAPDEGNCISEVAPKCVIGFSSDEGSTVNASSLPATPSYQSSTNGEFAQ